MKQKLSITIDTKTAEQAKQLVEDGRFRNKSHVMEYALVKLLRETMEDESGEAKK